MYQVMRCSPVGAVETWLGPLTHPRRSVTGLGWSWPRRFRCVVRRSTSAVVSDAVSRRARVAVVGSVAMHSVPARATMVAPTAAASPGREGRWLAVGVWRGAVGGGRIGASGWVERAGSGWCCVWGCL